MCAVKDRFLRETYIAGSAIFSVSFLETFQRLTSQLELIYCIHSFTIILYHYYLCIDHIIMYDYIMLFEFMCIYSYSIVLL